MNGMSWCGSNIINVNAITTGHEAIERQYGVDLVDSVELVAPGAARREACP